MAADHEATAIQILDGHRLMAISTVRPDGWPQTTVVGYANIGFLIYFMIFRSSQKFANIAHDHRVSIAVAPEPHDLSQVQAVYAGAFASEVIDEGEREQAWKLLTQRHPNLGGFELPDAEAAVMRAKCKYVSVLDYGHGWGGGDTIILE
jgi:hypothetical protein